MPLPFKWQFLRGVLVLQMILSASLVAWILYRVFRDGGFAFMTSENKIILGSSLFLLLAVFSFSMLVIHIIQRFFPDRIPGRALNIFFIIGYSFLFITCLALTMIFCMGAYDTYNRIAATGIPEEVEKSFFRKTIYLLAAIFLWIISIVYTLVYSFRLRRTVRNNYATALISDINRLGGTDHQANFVAAK